MQQNSDGVAKENVGMAYSPCLLKYLPEIKILPNAAKLQLMQCIYCENIYLLYVK